jgi:hypothetical protein
MKMTTQEDPFKFWVEFKQRVDNWHKNRTEVFQDRREAAYQFAIEVLDADLTKAREFTSRQNIQWNIIKSYAAQYGKRITCKVCGNEGYGHYWCRPCIHHDFCCECCILLGNPHYGGGMYIFGKRKCPYCGTEFTDGVHLGSTSNLGLGVTLSKVDPPKKRTCPKCGRTV